MGKPLNQDQKIARLGCSTNIKVLLKKFCQMIDLERIRKLLNETEYQELKSIFDQVDFEKVFIFLLKLYTEEKNIEIYKIIRKLSPLAYQLSKMKYFKPWKTYESVTQKNSLLHGLLIVTETIHGFNELPEVLGLRSVLLQNSIKPLYDVQVDSTEEIELTNLWKYLIANLKKLDAFIAEEIAMEFVNRGMLIQYYLLTQHCNKKLCIAVEGETPVDLLATLLEKLSPPKDPSYNYKFIERLISENIDPKFALSFCKKLGIDPGTTLRVSARLRNLVLFDSLCELDVNPNLLDGPNEVTPLELLKSNMLGQMPDEATQIELLKILIRWGHAHNDILSYIKKAGIDPFSAMMAAASEADETLYDLIYFTMQPDLERACPSMNNATPPQSLDNSTRLRCKSIAMRVECIESLLYLRMWMINLTDPQPVDNASNEEIDNAYIEHIRQLCEFVIKGIEFLERIEKPTDLFEFSDQDVMEPRLRNQQAFVFHQYQLRLKEFIDIILLIALNLGSKYCRKGIPDQVMFVLKQMSLVLHIYNHRYEFSRQYRLLQNNIPGLNCNLPVFFRKIYDSLPSFRSHLISFKAYFRAVQNSPGTNQNQYIPEANAELNELMFDLIKLDVKYLLDCIVRQSNYENPNQDLIDSFEWQAVQTECMLRVLQVLGELLYVLKKNNPSLVDQAPWIQELIDVRNYLIHIEKFNDTKAYIVSNKDLIVASLKCLLQSLTESEELPNLSLATWTKGLIECASKKKVNTPHGLFNNKKVTGGNKTDDEVLKRVHSFCIRLENCLRTREKMVDCKNISDDYMRCLEFAIECNLMGFFQLYNTVLKKYLKSNPDSLPPRLVEKLDRTMNQIRINYAHRFENDDCVNTMRLLECFFGLSKIIENLTYAARILEIEPIIRVRLMENSGSLVFPFPVEDEPNAPRIQFGYV